MIRFSFEGKVALITGASRGIGEAIAEALTGYGAHCILVSRDIEALERVVNKIEEKGGSAEAIACNIGYLEQINTLMDTVRENHGKLDILVNNAAANPYFGDMLNAEEWAWDKTNDINLKAPFFMIQAAAKMMMEAGGGAIVNVSSINGVRPAPFQGIYSITKAGLTCMTQAFAKELAPFNIRVNTIMPGLTDTKFSSAITAIDDIKNMVISQIPLKRIAQPEEIAGAVLYLLSDAASFTTGSCITCDGGMLA